MSRLDRALNQFLTAVLIFACPLALGCQCGVDSFTINTPAPTDIDIHGCDALAIGPGGDKVQDEVDDHTVEPSDGEPTIPKDGDEQEDGCNPEEGGDCDDVVVALQWRQSTGQVDGNLIWRLPNGQLGPVQKAPWSVKGAESFSESALSIPDGLVVDQWQN